MSEEQQEHSQLSVLLVAEDALDRDPMAKLVPTEHRLTVVHTELEAAALAYSQAQPDVLLLAINDLDASASFRNELLKKCGVAEDTAPMAVALCLNRHSIQAGDLCMRGVFDDFATAKPTPHTERIHLALRRAKIAKQLREDLLDARDRIGAARGQFETLATVHRELNGELQRLHTRLPEAVGPKSALTTLSENIARIAAQGRKACQGATKRVLVVDDDEMMREILGASLEAGGYEPRYAASAEEAVEQLVTQRVSLVLMDLMMPGLDGIAATREIRALPNYRTVPIIVVSGHGNRDSVRSSRAVGANDFLVKPVDQDKLIEKVRRYLD